jgi:hypothetical protein
MTRRNFELPGHPAKCDCPWCEKEHVKLALPFNANKKTLRRKSGPKAKDATLHRAARFGRG